MSEEIPGQKFGVLGLQLTKLYLIALFGGVPVLAFFGWVQIAPLSLNELGDFLAGAFGPLAIFWVVLGFFQQGRELRNSVQTLKLQAKELENSVAQQQELVRVTREQLNFERELLDLNNRDKEERERPKFLVSLKAVVGMGDGKKIFRLDVSNLTETVSNLHLRALQGETVVCEVERDLVPKDERVTVDAFQRKPISPPFLPTQIEIHFRDFMRRQWVFTYVFEFEENQEKNGYEIQSFESKIVGQSF